MGTTQQSLSLDPGWMTVGREKRKRTNSLAPGSSGFPRREYPGRFDIREIK